MTEFTIAFRIFRISEFKPMHSEFVNALYSVVGVFSDD